MSKAKSVFQSVIYHYTSSNVLMSIVKNKSIWLTGKHHLNDPDEGVVFDFLRKEYEDKNKTCLDDMAKYLMEYDFFINCMTEQRDRLSQWRGYGDQGRGVSIGFDSDKIKEYIKSAPELLLKNVNYIKKSSPMVPTYLENQFDQTKIRSERRGNGESVGAPTDNFLHTLKKEQCSLKYDSYEEECEIRLIYTTKDHADDIKSGCGTSIGSKKYIEINGAIREYYDLAIPVELIKEIYIGPKNKDQNIDVLTRFLKSNGFGHVEIKNSDLNFR